MFFYMYALMEVAASEPKQICMAQITCEFIYYTHGRLFFCDSWMIKIPKSIYSQNELILMPHGDLTSELWMI